MIEIKYNIDFKKALKELRNDNEAILPVVKRQIDAPEVKTLAPDGDFFFPTYVTDPQRAPFCFWRTSSKKIFHRSSSKKNLL